MNFIIALQRGLRRKRRLLQRDTRPVTFEREDAQEPVACELRSLLWNCRLSYVLSPSFRELVQGVEHRLAGDPDQPGKRLIQLQDQKNSAGDS